LTTSRLVVSEKDYHTLDFFSVKYDNIVLCNSHHLSRLLLSAEDLLLSPWSAWLVQSLQLHQPTCQRTLLATCLRDKDPSHNLRSKPSLNLCLDAEDLKPEQASLRHATLHSQLDLTTSVPKMCPSQALAHPSLIHSRDGRTYRRTGKALLVPQDRGQHRGTT
jgi:hypothetical protein